MYIYICTHAYMDACTSACMTVYIDIHANRYSLNP